MYRLRQVAVALAALALGAEEPLSTSLSTQARRLGGHGARATLGCVGRALTRLADAIPSSRSRGLGGSTDPVSNAPAEAAPAAISARHDSCAETSSTEALPGKQEHSIVVAGPSGEREAGPAAASSSAIRPAEQAPERREVSPGTEHQARARTWLGMLAGHGLRGRATRREFSSHGPRPRTGSVQRGGESLKDVTRYASAEKAHPAAAAAATTAGKEWRGAEAAARAEAEEEARLEAAAEEEEEERLVVSVVAGQSGEREAGPAAASSSASSSGARLSPLPRGQSLKGVTRYPSKEFV